MISNSGCFRGIFLAAAFTLLRDPSAAAAPLTPEQALDYHRVGDLHFSPDGSKLAYVTLTYRDDYAPHVWLMDVATASAHDLTPAKKSESSPQWSPDGKTLAFLSNRDGKTQVYTAPVDGGEAVALTAQKNGVQSYRWSQDGRSIAYLAKDDDAPGTDTGPQVADDARSIPRLWILDVGSKTKRRLTSGAFTISEFQWMDDANLLVCASKTPQIDEFTGAVYRIAAKGGTPKIVAQPPQPFGGLIVSPNGMQFAVLSTNTHGPTQWDIFLGSTRNGALHDVTAALDRVVVQIVWPNPNVLQARFIDGFHNRIVELPIGAAPKPVDLPLSAGAFDVARDGRIAYVGEDFQHLAEIYIRSPDGGIRQLTHLEKNWDGVALAATTIFKTKSFDGTEIESALMKPPEPRGAAKWPLVLLVHGGPSSNFSAGYGWEAAWAQMLVSHGYEVLLVNPRGSDGYSEDFVKANRGDWGGGDYKDLIAVLDAVIAKGETDTDRLGIGGWSYGGEMSEWAITQTNRFKAAVVGAGVFDQAAEFEAENHSQGDEWYFGVPWDHPDVFAHNSPSTFIRNARTPTLIFDGEDDRNNPVGQSKGLYRALKHYGVETEMVLYPDEGHSPVRWDSNVDMFQRLLDWYDLHLKGTKLNAAR